MTPKKKPGGKKRRSHGVPVTSSAEASYVCPSCLETVDTFPDPGAGEHQNYVEDCAVCCRPNVINATWDESEAAWSIEASRE